MPIVPGARAICGVLLGALSVGPPEDGANITVGAGGGQYQYRHTGCGNVDTNVYGVNSAQVYGAVTHRTDHFTFVAEGTVAPGVVKRASCIGCEPGAPDLGKGMTAGMA